MLGELRVIRERCYLFDFDSSSEFVFEAGDVFLVFDVIEPNRYEIARVHMTRFVRVLTRQGPRMFQWNVTRIASNTVDEKCQWTG